jgi:hypothetical protein
LRDCFNEGVFCWLVVVVDISRRDVVC